MRFLSTAMHMFLQICGMSLCVCTLDSVQLCHHQLSSDLWFNTSRWCYDSTHKQCFTQMINVWLAKRFSALIKQNCPLSTTLVHPLCLQSWFYLWWTSLPPTKYLLCPNPVIIIFMNSIVSILNLILKHPVPLPLSLFSPNVTTVTHYSIIFHTLRWPQQIQNCLD